MKKTIIAALMAICMGITSGAMAQQTRKTDVPRQRPTVEQMAQKRTEMMTQKLGLNEEQAKKVYDVNLANAKSMEMHRTQMKAERRSEAEQMKEILTTDQFVKWSQMQGQGHRMNGRDGKDGKNCRNGKMKRDCSGAPCTK